MELKPVLSKIANIELPEKTSFIEIQEIGRVRHNRINIEEAKDYIIIVGLI